MKMLEEQLKLAAQNKHELNQLIIEYIPFIKKQLVGFGNQIEYDDMLSLGMITFASSILQYKDEKGSFLGFAAINIKHRLIDEIRKQKRYQEKVVSFYREETQQDGMEFTLSIEAYDREEERLSLSMEIEQYSKDLSQVGLSFSELTKSSPKHKASRKQCFSLARKVIEEEDMRQQFLKHKTLPQKELAQHFSISVKTVEKHRRYIVALVLLLLGDYTYIQTFVSGMKEEGR